MEGRLEQKIQFWSALGPFVVVLTLFVCFIKLSAASYYLPLAALVGLPICWKWHLKGALAAFLLLTALLSINLPFIETSERMWFVGLGIALSIGFAVTALSLEEMRELLGLAPGRQSQDSDSTAERFSLLRQQWRHDREEFQHRLALLMRQLKEAQEAAPLSLSQKPPELTALQSELSLTQRQLEAVQAQFDSLQRDYQTLKESPAIAARPMLSPEERDIRHLEGKYLQLRSQFEEKQKVLDETRRQAFHFEGKMMELQQKLSPAECTEEVRLLTEYIAYLEHEYVATCQEVDDLSLLVVKECPFASSEVLCR